jgi:hypothetical protein
MFTDEGSQQRAEVLWAETVGATGLLDTLRYFPRRDGVLFNDPRFTLVKGGYTIRDPGGKQLDQDMSFDGSILLKPQGCFEIYKAWDSNTYQLFEDYIVDWQVRFVDALSGETFFNDRQFFDVVRTKLYCTVDDNNLQSYYPDLPLAIQALGVTDTKRWINLAWSQILERVRSGGHRPSLVVDNSRFFNPALHLSLSLVADALSREPDDLWGKRADKHSKRYDEAWNGMGQLKYDYKQIGLADPAEVARINRRGFSV